MATSISTWLTWFSEKGLSPPISSLSHSGCGPASTPWTTPPARWPRPWTSVPGMGGALLVVFAYLRMGISSRRFQRSWSIRRIGDEYRTPPHGSRPGSCAAREGSVWRPAAKCRVLWPDWLPSQLDRLRRRTTTRDARRRCASHLTCVAADGRSKPCG